MRDASHILHSSNKLFAMTSIDQKTSDEEINSILESKEIMMDVVGVIQHHDGISGTGKQHVADDYTKRISKAISQTNPVYAEIIAKIAEGISLSGSENWEWC